MSVNDARKNCFLTSTRHKPLQSEVNCSSLDFQPMRSRLIAGFVCLMLLPSCAAREEWRTVTDANGEFEVDLPSDPQDISRTRSVGDAEITVVGKLCEIQNGYISCGVTVSTFPETADAEDLFKTIDDQTLQSLDGAVLTKEPETEFAGYPSQMFVAISGDKQDRVTYRSVQVGNRIYAQILAETSGKQLSVESRRRFLSSLKITASRPTDDAQPKTETKETPTEPAKAESP